MLELKRGIKKYTNSCTIARKKVKEPNTYIRSVIYSKIPSNTYISMCQKIFIAIFNRLAKKKCWTILAAAPYIFFIEFPPVLIILCLNVTELQVL